jgi:hypothetical protein
VHWDTNKYDGEIVDREDTPDLPRYEKQVDEIPEVIEVEEPPEVIEEEPEAVKLEAPDPAQIEQKAKKEKVTKNEDVIMKNPREEIPEPQKKPLKSKEESTDVISETDDAPEVDSEVEVVKKVKKSSFSKSRKAKV